MSLALQRDDVVRGTADDRKAVYWTGQTLLEMETSVKKPMTVVAESLKITLSTLRPTDSVSMIAFANKVATVFTATDWKSDPDSCSAKIDAMRDQAIGKDIGNGTLLADALNRASELLGTFARLGSINRLVVLSDGIVQDSADSMARVDEIQRTGYAITTIGVGEEFDEEFLTRVADSSRGQYHYAADVAEVTSCLEREMSHLERTTITDLYVAVRGVNGTFIQDIAAVRPAMAIFDEMFTQNEWTSARIGDVSSSSPITVLVQFLPVHSDLGSMAVADVQLLWANAGDAFAQNKETKTVTIDAVFSSDPLDRFKENRKVVDVVDRYTVFKLEREAQRAKDRGDVASAKEKYGAATRKLTSMGEPELAGQIEKQIETLSTGVPDPAAEKRLKSNTRRLAVSVPRDLNS